MLRGQASAGIATMLQSSQKAARSPLLQLPPELLHCIYLHCLEPNMALASGYLGAVLSSESLLRATVFQAFWNPTPFTSLKFAKQLGTQLELTRYHSLAQSTNLRELNPSERERMQRLVLVQRWCTFDRLWNCFSILLSTIWQDLVQELELSFAPEHQIALNNLINNPPGHFAKLEAKSLSGVSVYLEHSYALARGIVFMYAGTDRRHRPIFRFQPAEVVTLPDNFLRGDAWTDSKILRLQMVCTAVDLDRVTYSRDGFYDGMRNAVLQGNPKALLVLAWAVSRTSHQRGGYPNVRRIEMPKDLFRLAIPDMSEENEVADATAISMFKILIRTHAESMPQNDNDIIAWATSLLSRARDRAFGQWLIDFSTRPNVSTPSTIRRKEFRFHYFFWGGRISERTGEESMKAFCRIDGSQPKMFEHELNGQPGVVAPLILCYK